MIHFLLPLLHTSMQLCNIPFPGSVGNELTMVTSSRVPETYTNTCILLHQKGTGSLLIFSGIHINMYIYIYMTEREATGHVCKVKKKHRPVVLDNKWLILRMRPDFSLD